MLRSCMVSLARNARPLIQNNSRRTIATTTVRWKNELKEELKEERVEKNPIGVEVTTTKGVQVLDPGTGELELEEDVTQKYVDFFKNVENDGWLARNAMNDLMQQAFVPEPAVTIAVMHSCRRMNDYALAVRYLESLKHLLFPKCHVIWPWYIQEIKPTLDELGIQSPEDMGFETPEYYLPNVDDIHGLGKQEMRDKKEAMRAQIAEYRANRAERRKARKAKMLAEREAKKAAA